MRQLCLILANCFQIRAALRRDRRPELKEGSNDERGFEVAPR